jgi:predicted nucleotidyltransferase
LTHKKQNGLEAEVIARLQTWAESRDAVSSLWLFGSRAKGISQPNSDYDIAIELSSAKGDHDWAFGDFVFCYDEWKSELRQIVQGEVSLVGFRDDLMGRFDPRDSGIVLWTRSLSE